jgi:hypothetical protein
VHQLGARDAADAHAAVDLDAQRATGTPARTASQP